MLYDVFYYLKFKIYGFNGVKKNSYYVGGFAIQILCPSDEYVLIAQSIHSDAHTFDIWLIYFIKNINRYINTYCFDFYDLAPDIKNNFFKKKPTYGWREVLIILYAF